MEKQLNISTEYVSLKELAQYKTAKIHYSSVHKSLVVQSTANYIPMEEFRDIFEKTLLLITNHVTEKVVFDKRTLTIFHQPSMEWYFTEWKSAMAKMGVTKHRKILPEDQFFVSSVKIARQKLDKDYPTAIYHQLDIQYFDTLPEALKN